MARKQLRTMSSFLSTCAIERGLVRHRRQCFRGVRCMKDSSSRPAARIGGIHAYAPAGRRLLLKQHSSLLMVSVRQAAQQQT